jgi:16S rRNA (cytidine1402-2'-O)-methyltransferase
MKNPGKLYIVSTPIGNMGDITLRAIEVLKTVDGIVCEERKPGSTLLKRLGIEEKEIFLLNEHNEVEEAANILLRLLNGQTLALISDCGTPVFSDPGAYLIQLASSSGVVVSPLPGASSLMAALAVLDFRMDHFTFGGFLPRDPDARRRELTRYKSYRMPLVLMDTPYRLGALLDDISKVYGKLQQVTIAFDMTLASEKVFRGPVGEIRSEVGSKKGEFILIIGS